MTSRLFLTAVWSIIPLVTSQQIGTTPEHHPSLPTWECTTQGGCIKQQTSVVIDWNYREINQKGAYQSCTTGSGGVDTTLCPDEATCFQNCVVEGVNYTSLGIDVSGAALTLHQYMSDYGGSSGASPRAYLLGPDQDYVLLSLLNREVSFDVDVSGLPCGENGALYLAQMDKTGGRSEYNPGGAGYGAGYCDAQCPVEAWKNGSVNTDGSGYCCTELDIWESNRYANAFTPHPCQNGACDSNGCVFNPYSQGQQNYYGPGLTVDTQKPFTVTTQFLTDDGTATGTLSEIRRHYIQDGKIIPNAVSTSGVDCITDAFCATQDSALATFGGLSTVGQALGTGMVLAFSIWNDDIKFMNWLDSGSSGPCSSTSGNPATIEAQDPTTSVTFSNIKWGDLNSTFTIDSNGCY